jgi:hypothetical protein
MYQCLRMCNGRLRMYDVRTAKCSNTADIAVQRRENTHTADLKSSAGH